MTDAIILRLDLSDQGVFSRVVVPSAPEFSCVMGELPWRGNARDVSCIPCGVYEAVREWLTMNGKSYFGYRVHGVPGRTGILIHRANWFGDKTLGWKADVDGCMGPGLNTSALGGQKMVVRSQGALNALVDVLGEKCRLRVVSGCDETFAI